MAAGVLYALCLLVFVPFGGAWPRQLSDANTLSLYARQDDPTIDPPTCEAACDLNTCGGATCSASSLTKRSFDTWDALLTSFDSNDTEANEAYALDSRGLSKRIWRFDPASDDPVGDTAPSVAEVDKYLPAVFGGEEYDAFGDALPIATGGSAPDERAYSQQVEFGDNAFQIMTGGIHGCMTVTLVSNRAVWMAHFWESYSHRGVRDSEPKDEPATDPLFVERIIKFIRGEAVDKPTPGYKIYIAPTADGGAIKPDLFNGADDETMLFISTPIAEGASISARRPKLKYEKRVGEMEKAFKSVIGKTPQIFRVPYQRLNYNDPADEAIVNKANRGMHLFQYDPSSDGKGKRSWRLFNEARYKVHNLP